MIRWESGPLQNGNSTWTTTGGPICPDLLRGEMLGEADNLRGRIVRAFFAILDRVMPVRT